ncbi:hypothetical protein D3C76_569410 [compost metagenome]
MSEANVKSEPSACGYSVGDWECRPGAYLFDAGTGEGYDPQDCTYLCPHCRTQDYLESAKEEAESVSSYGGTGGSGTGLDIWKAAERQGLEANRPAALNALAQLGPVQALNDDEIVLCNTQQAAR